MRPIFGDSEEVEAQKEKARAEYRQGLQEAEAKKATEEKETELVEEIPTTPKEAGEEEQTEYLPEGAE